MARVLRRAVPLLLIVLVAAAAILVATARPKLRDTHDAVTARWTAVAPELDPRYDRLRDANGAAKAVGGPPRAVTADIDAALARWNRLRERSPGDVIGGVRAANELEALRRRLEANISASARLRDDQGVQQALAALSGLEVPPEVRAFNAAVADYESERNGFLRGPVTQLFGYEEIPALDLDTGALART
jgi:hypothetical protein